MAYWLLWENFTLTCMYEKPDNFLCGYPDKKAGDDYV